MNTVPEMAVTDYDIRYTEDQSPEEIIKRIEELSAKYGATVEVLTVGANVFIDKNHAYVKQYVKIMEEYGLEVVFSKDYGASDARFFMEHDIPVILTQPYGLDWHSNEERVSIKSTILYQKMLEDFLEKFEK